MFHAVVVPSMTLFDIRHGLIRFFEIPYNLPRTWIFELCAMLKLIIPKTQDS